MAGGGCPLGRKHGGLALLAPVLALVCCDVGEALTGCALVKLFGLRTAHPYAGAMGSWAVTGDRQGGRPVYRHVSNPWKMLYGSKRWEIHFVSDRTAPPIAFANTHAREADAIAPIGGEWHVRDGRNYTLVDGVKTHCDPVCRVVEVKHARNVTSRAAGFYVLQYKTFHERHLFAKMDAQGTKTFLLWSSSHQGWAIAPRAADQNVLLFSSDAIADAPSGLHGAAWYFPGSRRKALGVHASCAESCRRYKIAGLNKTDALHRYTGVYTLQHNEVLGGPTYVKFGVMWGDKHLYFAKGECRIGSHKLADGSFSTTLRARSLATTGIPGVGWEALAKVTKHRREFERKPSLTAWCVQDDCLGASTCASCTATATCGWCMSNHKCTSAHYCAARAWKQRCGSAPLHALPGAAAATGRAPTSSGARALGVSLGLALGLGLAFFRGAASEGGRAVELASGHESKRLVGQ